MTSYVSIYPLRGDGTRKNWVTASGENDSGLYPAENAYNGQSGTEEEWICDDVNVPNPNGQCWIQLDFQEPIGIVAARFRRRTLAQTNRHFPKDVVVKASDSGAFAGEDITVDTLQLADVAGGTWTDWVDIESEELFRYYRFEIHSRWVSGAGDWVSIDEMEFKEGLYFSGGLEPGPNTATLAITLRDRNGVLRANETGLTVLFFDDPDPADISQARAVLTGQSTDAGGVLSITIPNTVLADGEIGHLWVTNSDGTVGQHQAFSSPVAVSVA